MKIDDSIMNERRLERLRHVTFFMTDERAPKVLALGAVHNLLTGWFENSHWRTAWYCIKYAMSSSYQRGKFTVEILYYKYILRLTEQQIDARFDGQEGE